MWNLKIKIWGKILERLRIKVKRKNKINKKWRNVKNILVNIKIDKNIKWFIKSQKKIILKFNLWKDIYIYNRNLKIN